MRAPRAGRVRRNEAAPGRGHRPSLARTTPHSHPRSGTAPREGAKPAARLPPASAPPGGEPHRRLLPEQKLCVSNGNRAARQLPPPPPPPAPISASRVPPAGRDLPVYRGSRTPSLPHWVGGCRGAKQGDTIPGHTAGPRPGAGRPARRFRPLRPPPLAFLPPPHPSPAPSFPAHARAAPPGREEGELLSQGAERGRRVGEEVDADCAPQAPAGAMCATS